MTQINSAKELKATLERLKALNRLQEEELAARIKEIETSLQPQNILRQGITGMLKGNKANHGFIPVLIGAGVEAGLDRLLSGKSSREGLLSLTGGGMLQKLAGSILGSGELGERLKKIFSPAKKEEKQPEK